MAAAADDPDATYAYSLEAPAEEKALALARTVYNADDVSWTPAARRQLRAFKAHGWGQLPICMAKTPLSISHDPARKGRPSGYTFPIVDIRASVGAGFLYALAGPIETLPGLPTRPRALDMDVTADGEIIEELYLAALARHPRPEERDGLAQLVRRSSSRGEGLKNLVWALLASREFAHNH